MEIRRVLFCFVFIFSLFSCTSFDKSKLKNLNQGRVVKIGHGGSGFSSWIPFNSKPINSMASFKHALIENAAEGIELDLQMTADGKFIVYHDIRLDSKTGMQGCISNQLYKDIVDVPYELGIPFDWFQNEKVIGFEELIQFCKSLDSFPQLHIDLRIHSDCFSMEENGKWESKIFEKLMESLSHLGVPKEKVLIISLHRSFIELALAKECPYKLSLEEYGTFEQGLEFVLEKKIEYLTIKPSLLTAKQSAIAHEAGIKIITFGAKSKSGNRKLLELNPDMIQSNNLSALNKLLE